MNKSELIKALADKTNGTQAEAKAFLEALVIFQYC
jgi:nucleoid DNA-binding protein